MPRLPMATLAAAVCAFSLSGCGFLAVRGAKHAYAEYQRQGAQVDAGLARFARGIALQDEARLAGLFTPEGTLSMDGGPATPAAEAIHRLAEMGQNRSIVDCALLADDRSVAGTGATQRGRYQVWWREAGGEVRMSSGRFDARWIRQRTGEWQVDHAELRGDPATASAPGVAAPVTAPEVAGAAEPGIATAGPVAGR